MENELKVFKALADETRLKIVRFLLEGEKCVCEIIPHTGRKQSTVSLQLKKLENYGIISSRRDGKRIYYNISNPEVLGILKVI